MKRVKGFSLVEVLVSTLLIGMLFTIFSGLITFFFTCSRSIEGELHNKTRVQILELLRIANTINMTKEPIILNAAGPELTFTYDASGLDRINQELIRARIFFEKGTLFLEKKGKDDKVFEVMPLFEGIKKPTISLFVHKKQGGSTRFTQIFQTKEEGFIPRSIRFEMDAISFDLNVPLLLQNDQLLHLHISPTIDLCS